MSVNCLDSWLSRPRARVSTCGLWNWQVRNERQACEVLLKWFERRRAGGHDVPQPCRYLSRIRWSGVDAEFVRTTLLRDTTVTQVGGVA